MIDPATIERIKNTADIVEVVGDYVHLIRRGSNYMGLCPFHNERTPSFSVNKNRNFCYCFSCKKGGSPVNFIMEKEGLSYHEALLHLAKRYGIEVVERELTDEEREKQSRRESMFVANEWAMSQMEQDMVNTDEGRDVGLQYFMERGVTDEAIKAFHLGYAIDNGSHLTEAAKKAGFNLDVFKSLGLIGTSQQGRDYDRFRGRVIFPVFNTAGKVIAFGGRDLKGGLAKYINSPESDLYKKSNELYGMYQAKSSIVKDDKCYLVEGYMDVIGMWQAGMRNVVASSGTALTDGQIAMIHRFTENITLIYDGDAAGIKASLRGIDMLLSHKLNVKVMLLPDGDDPDSFAKKHTAEEFREYVASHETDIIRYKAQVLLKEADNDPRSRISAINSVVESIAHIPDQVSRDIYVQECSELLGISEKTISDSVAKSRAGIVEGIKRERQRRRVEELDKQEQPAPVAETQKPEKLQSSKLSRKSILEQYPYYPLEQTVIKHCIKYAFLPFCSYEDENNNLVSLDVLQFIREELINDDMHFSYPDFERIFNILEQIRPSFEKYYAGELSSIESKISSIRNERFQEIADKAMSAAEIKKAERILEDELDNTRQQLIRNSIKEYPGKVLCSHEDDAVRNISLELLFEKHHLSNIYQKATPSESEEDKLSILIVRALDEWKNEIIRGKMEEIFTQLRDPSINRDYESEMELQDRLAALIKMRQELAKSIGERILSNRVIGNKPGHQPSR